MIIKYSGINNQDELLDSLEIETIQNITKTK